MLHDNHRCKAKSIDEYEASFHFDRFRRFNFYSDRLITYLKSASKNRCQGSGTGRKKATRLFDPENEGRIWRLQGVIADMSLTGSHKFRHEDARGNSPGVSL